MKIKIHLLLFGALTFLALNDSNAQIQQGKRSYPNVTKDHIGNTPVFGGLKHVLALPGVWGLGLQYEILKPNIIYGSAEAGYGWVIGKHENDFDKKWRPWIDVQVGYPLFTFKTKKTGKWVISEKYVADGVEQQFYKISVPMQRTFIPYISYKSIPFNTRIYSTSSGPSTFTSVNAPVFSFGVKLLSRLRSDVAVIDSDTGKKETGSVLSRSEISIAMSMAVGAPPEMPEGYGGLNQFEGLGWEFMFRIPVNLNFSGSFDIGLRGLHVSSDADGQAAQLYLGNTFYF